MQWSYDALGREYRLTYPDNEVVTYQCGANGLVSQITSSLGATLVQSVEYNALSRPKKVVLGPAGGPTAELRHTFYGVDGVAQGTAPYGALKTIQLQQGLTPMLVNRDLAYDPRGNVSSVNDLVNVETIAYAYDDLDRLLSASAPAGETFAYNAIGNLTSKGGTALTYPAAGQPRPHAVTAFGTNSYGYDANGCMTTRNAQQGNQSLKYDPESRPVRVDLAGQSDAVARFAYDGSSGRRKRLDVNGTIHYVGVYERNAGNGASVGEAVTKLYHANLGRMRRLIAVRKNGTLYWVGTDHLGGTVRVADASFAPVDQMRYTPYGVPRDAGTSLPTDHLFTSQVYDASTGLYWYGSQAYDPHLGRFTAPDTLVPGGGPAGAEPVRLRAQQPPAEHGPRRARGRGLVAPG
jgi:RHS repeat-associated protein